jgi:hypothetical protein
VDFDKVLLVEEAADFTIEGGNLLEGVGFDHEL